MLLGTGTPNADPRRSGPAVAIVFEGKAYIVDCGPGIVRRAAAAAERHGIEALQPRNLKHVFISHLHSDHTVGLPDLIFTPWVLERDEPLKVFGPPGIQLMAHYLQLAYQQDITIRRRGLQPANDAGYKTEVKEIRPGLIYQDKDLKVIAFQVKHGLWPHAFGFRFETPDRKIIISGDTTPCPGLTRSAKGCDVLIHEVYSVAGFNRRPKPWQRYHAAFHTSADQLAEIANEIRPGLLILYHQLFWGSTEEELLGEVRRGYDGTVVCGEDLDLY